MPRRPLSLRVSPELAALLEQLAELRGLSKTEIVIAGILAQAEAFGLIPSVIERFAQLRPESHTDPDLLRRNRLSQQRSRARRRGENVPKLKPGRPLPRRPHP
jgi:hypothetical protein